MVVSSKSLGTMSLGVISHLNRIMEEIQQTVSMVNTRLATNSALLIKNSPWHSKMYIPNNNSKIYSSNNPREDNSQGVHLNSSKQNHLSQVRTFNRPEVNNSSKNNKLEVKQQRKIQIVPGDKVPNW